MGNAQSDAGAAKFFGGITDLATKPFNMASQVLIGQPIIPSAQAAIARDPYLNPQAQKTGQIQGSFGGFQQQGGFGTFGQGQIGQMMQMQGMPGWMNQGQKPMCPMDMSPGSIACRNGGQAPADPYAAMYAQAGMMPMGQNQFGTGGPYTPTTPVNTQPAKIGQQQNPTAGNTGVAAPGGATSMGATQQSATQGMPPTTATAPPAAASGVMPVIDNTTMLMLAGGVALTAVLLAKKK